MPRISHSSIEQIKQQVSLLDVVSPYVQLKRAGRSWKGLSPFTQEKTPSFYVHPDKGFYKCFSSGEGGDLYTFVMKMENLEFAEAVEFIAKRFNITLDYEQGGPSREQVSMRKQLFDIHETTTEWFHRQFMESDAARAVRDYWCEARGFDLEVARELRIGFAPPGRNALAKQLESAGYGLDVLHQSGLFFGREPARAFEQCLGRFRGRLTIPIRDVQGRVVGFTARQLPETPEDDPAREAKYVNSPETPIFQKSRLLFGMDHARKHLREGDSFLLVEGQLDAIRCWSVGLHTAVAPQGTAITEEQLRLLRRYEPSTVDCLLDGDAAGQKAALRLLPLAFKAGLECRFLSLPAKTDPDDLLRGGGADALDGLRSQSRSAIELAVAAKLPDDRPPSTHEKTATLQSIFELVRNVDSEVAREDYIQAAARRVGVDPIAAGRDYEKYMRQHQKAAPTAADRNNPAPGGHDTLLTQATWELLWLVLNFPNYAKPIAETIDYEWIDTSEPAGRLLARLVAEIREDMIDDPAELESIVESTEDRALLADIHSRDLDLEEPKSHLECCLKTLARNYLSGRKHALEQKIRNAAPNSEEEMNYLREMQRLRASLRKAITLPL